MKMICAIIRPDKLEEVKQGLRSIGIKGLTIYEVRGKGRQEGVKWSARGHEYGLDMLPKLKIEVLVSDENLDAVVDVIAQKAKTGYVGDGKIFVVPVEEVVRIRTGERGKEAL
ncbi:MAG: P-II family nitrogen regulator [Candidatus Nezhaarchaeota archaeon]|nr:P-II family nitrogen regulator [Candidatus Nezhaarchaeota archaeon]